MRRSSAVLAILAGFAVASCGSDAADEPTSSAVAGQWRLVEVVVDDAAAPVDESGVVAVQIDDAESSLRGVTPCGRIFGSFSVDPPASATDGATTGSATFTVPSDDASTCSDAEQTVATATVDGLERVSSWERPTPDRLVLTGPSVRLTFAADG